MSQIILAAIIQLLTVLLPAIGVQLGSDQLTNFAQTIIIIGTSAWIWVRRYQQKDVSPLGVRK